MTGMGEKEVSPQEDITNPQDIEMLAAKKYGLSEKIVPFRALYGVQQPPVVIAPDRAIFWGPLYRGRYR